MNLINQLSDIYNLYVDDLFTYGTYMGFDREVVKDAIHDVFVKLSSDQKILNDVNNIKFFLLKSLKNRLLDINRKDKKQITLDDVNFDEDMPFRIQVNMEDRYIEEEERELTKSKIEEMLNSLTSKQREIIYLRYIHEYDYEQISELLSISVQSCRKLVSKALKNLRIKYGSLTVLLLLL